MPSGAEVFLLQAPPGSMHSPYNKIYTIQSQAKYNNGNTSMHVYPKIIIMSSLTASCLVVEYKNFGTAEKLPSLKPQSFRIGLRA